MSSIVLLIDVHLSYHLSPPNFVSVFTFKLILFLELIILFSQNMFTTTITLQYNITITIIILFDSFLWSLFGFIKV